MSAEKKSLEKLAVGTGCDDNVKQPVEKQVDIDADVPLAPRNGYLVVEARDVPQFTREGLRVPSSSGQSVICEVVAVGPGRKKADGEREPVGYHIGQYVICNPRSIELSWPWLHRTFQVIMAHAVVAVIPDEYIRAMEARADAFGEKNVIAKPPKDRIVGPDGEAV